MDQCRGDVDGGVLGFERDMFGDEGVPGSTRVHEADQPVATEDRHREVPVHPLGVGHVGLETMPETEQALGSLPVPGEGVEGRDEQRAASRPALQGPERRLRSEGRPVPSFDLDREQARALDHLFDLPTREAVVRGEIGGRRHAQGHRRSPDEPDVAVTVGELDPEKVLRDRTLGEVVDALEALTPAADELTDVEEPFGSDLGLAPVPPRSALLGPTELSSRERTFGPDAVAHIGAALVSVFQTVPPTAAYDRRPALEGVRGPVLQREDAGGVRPVLEGRARRSPVGPLDPGTPNGPEPGEGDQLVGAGQDRDRVELHGAQACEHRRGPSVRARPEECLCCEGDSSSLTGAQGDLRFGHDTFLVGAGTLRYRLRS